MRGFIPESVVTQVNRAYRAVKAAVTADPDAALNERADLQGVFSLDHSADNFAERRAAQGGAGNAYDPESLLTGFEREAGLDYDDARDRGPYWNDPKSSWQRALRGEIPVGAIDVLFPRRAGMMYNDAGDYVPRAVVEYFEKQNSAAQ